MSDRPLYCNLIGGLGGTPDPNCPHEWEAHLWEAAARHCRLCGVTLRQSDEESGDGE
jgi:hypothetical protein